MKTTTYILPAYWASALINNDFSGIKDNEESEIRSFLSKNNLPFPVQVDGLDSDDFRSSNDANNMGGNVATYTFLLIN